MKTSWFVSSFAGLLWLASAGAGVALGQGATTGAIRGQVTSGADQPATNAQVAVTNEETGFSRTTVTDARGRYAVPLLPPGRYTVAVRSLGNRPVTMRGVQVGVGQAQTVDASLQAAAVTLEEVTVVGDLAAIDATQAGVAQTITTAQIVELPTLGRDFTDFLNLSPLVSPQPQVTTGGQFSIGGARTSGTNVQIDGADANNVFFGENRGSSRTPFTFSLESIKEFQLITNGFDVEYGNYQGGVVNAVTKGGTNTLGATGFLFFRDEALTRDDFAGNAPADFRVYQFGASVSGPIMRDKLHFFVSFDGQRKNQPVFAADPAASGIHPDSLTRFLSILQNTYGLSNPGQYFGQKTQQENDLVLFGRLDWTINQNHRLTLRQNFSDFEQTNDRIAFEEAVTHGGPFQDQTISTVAELNSILGGRAFNTFRFQFSYEDRPRPFLADAGFLPEIEVRSMDPAGQQIIEFGGDGIVFRNRLEERKLQLIDNFTLRLGSHTLKLGTSNMLSKTINTFWLNGNGVYVFNDLTDFAAQSPNQYSRNLRACPVALVNNAAGQPVICPQYDVPFAEFSALEWSAYAQDAWQVNDRLIVTGGVRIGGTDFADEPSVIPAVDAAFGVQTGVAPGFTGVSPRLALTYDLKGDQQHLLRAGGALLVGRAPTVLAGNVFQADKPLLSVFCTRTAGNVPTLNLQELLASDDGQNNPVACSTGAAPTGTPEHSIFHPDFKLPRTWKANVGYEGLIGSGTRLALDVIFSQSSHQFTVQDINLRQMQFVLPAEGRPVHVSTAQYNPVPPGTPTTNRRANTGFDRIFRNLSAGEARAFNVAIEVDQRIADPLRLGIRYGWNHAYDNSSFSCCTSFEGFTGEPTSGDPNFVGDIGDDTLGTWGPSRFERRHTIVANLRYEAPAGIRVSGIWRLQSGTPWTPVVNGDVNGDGDRFNDRAFVGNTLQFTTPADQARMDSLIAAHECLANQVGRMAARNSCRNPWFNSLDLRISWQVPTASRHRVELLVDLFNVLNGINKDWGRFMGVFSANTNLLQPTGYVAATRNAIYSVPSTFGTSQPSGFDPFQFQAQVGLRYRI